MTPQVTENKIKGTCGCGRTANSNGNCDGSHGLTETDWHRVKSARDLADYQKQAQDLWFKDGSCTGGGSEMGGGSSVK